MKRKVFTILTLTVLAVLVLAVSPTSAATRRISLWSAQLEYGKTAAVFTFRVWGDFDKFSGYILNSGNQTALNCNLQGNGEVLICRMAKGVPGLAGKLVQVVVNGFSFDAVIENVPVCHPVYDWPNPPGGSLGPWENYGEHCVDRDLKPGDLEVITTDGWGTWEYVFLTEGGFCGPDGSWNDYGKGFYYPRCIN